MEKDEVAAHRSVDQFLELFSDFLFAYRPVLGLGGDEGLSLDGIKSTLFVGRTLARGLDDEHIRVSAPSPLLFLLVVAVSCAQCRWRALRVLA